MATQPKPQITPEQYLEIERKAEYKSEYFAGEMFAMSGGRGPHNLIGANLIGNLHAQLRGKPCCVFTSDMRVRVDPTGLYTYPDLTVACGAPQYADATMDTLVNPILVAEVLSPSTEAYDRGLKFEHYRTIASLRQYLLVSSDRTHLDLFTKHDDGSWMLSSAGKGDSQLALDSIGCTLLIADVYDRVEF